ncbi:MAG: haloacid dehalogenase type II [Pseudomonadota bacterium]
MQSNVKLVTFDVYMALVDIQGGLTETVAAALSLPADTAGSFVTEWRAAQMLRAASSNSLARGHTRFRDCTRMALRSVAGRRGIDLSETDAENLVRAWDRLPPWPEADAALAEVKALGVGIGILSNGDPDMLAAIAAQFETPFDHILSAATAGQYKPHPAVYALPETILGLDRNATVHVAGSANDVLGARAYGMPCIWSNRRHDAPLDVDFAATTEVASLTGVADALAALT